jgi:hypothetical protein
VRDSHDGTSDAYADSVAIAEPVPIAIAEPVAIAIAEPVTIAIAKPGADLHPGEPRL